MAASQKRDRPDSLTYVASDNPKVQCVLDKKDSSDICEIPSFAVIQDWRYDPETGNMLMVHILTAEEAEARLKSRKKCIKVSNCDIKNKDLSTPESLKYDIKIIKNRLYYGEKLIFNLCNSSLLNISYLIKVDSAIKNEKDEIKKTMVELIVKYFNEVSIDDFITVSEYFQ